MAKRTFTVEIEMGNAAMQTADDVAATLRRVARQLAAFSGKRLRPVDSRRVFDANGNTVGSFNITEAP